MNCSVLFLSNCGEGKREGERDRECTESLAELFSFRRRWFEIFNQSSQCNSLVFNFRDHTFILCMNGLRFPGADFISHKNLLHVKAT